MLAPAPAFAQQRTDLPPPGSVQAVPPTPTYPGQPPPPPSKGLNLDIRAQVEVGNEPTVQGGDLARFKTMNGTIPLVNTQITGRLPVLEVGIEQSLVPGVAARMSGSLNQAMRVPITNADQEDAFLQRQAGRLNGALAPRPLFIPQLEDAYLVLADKDRGGGLQLGQFRMPFSYDLFSTAAPPQVLAPEETPMGDVIAALGATGYQPSTLVRRHDIGLMLFGTSGTTYYAAGTFNGSGPNRLDDNSDKDIFARADWRPSKNEELGFSILVGNDHAYPGGLGTKPATAPIVVQRRFYGVHAKFQLLQFDIRTEWLSALQIGGDPAPRTGWYIDVSGPVTDADRVYAQYGHTADPHTPVNKPYAAQQLTFGTLHAFSPGLNWRTEYLYRWEFLGSLKDDYGKYLTSVEWIL